MATLDRLISEAVARIDGIMAQAAQRGLALSIAGGFRTVQRQLRAPGRVSSNRGHSSCQTSVSSKPATSGPASTAISVSSLPHAVAVVVLDEAPPGAVVCVGVREVTAH